MRLHESKLRTTNGHDARRGRRFGIVLAASAVALLAAAGSVLAKDWAMFGVDATNSANNSTAVDASNVGRLTPKWVFTTGGDVSARAAVVNSIAYFPDWAGNLWAVDADSGRLIWSHQLSDYGLAAHTVSRTSPAVVNNTVYLGTQAGAWLLAINAKTGRLIWKTQVESDDPFAVVTSSPTVIGGVVYTGAASTQEALAAFVPGFLCCSARGSAVAIDATSGAIKWKTYTAPPGYSGTGVWGGNPVVDATRRTVFVSTGNNYSVPTAPDFVACIAGGGTRASCLSPDDHVDSILALNMDTGEVRWATRLLNWNDPFAINGSDSWNVACFVPPFTNCPDTAGPDYDFGSAPNLITYQSLSGPKTILGAGQKSGIYYALDPDTGAVLWQTLVGPGSSLGGIEWGSASDGKRIYVAIVNFYGIPYTARGLPDYGSAGSLAALDPATGAVLWQVADPNGSINLGPVAVSNGVVYAGSMAGDPSAPNMFALDAATGATLWSFASGASVIAGATIVGGTVYWGSGYTNLGIPGYTGNNRFYAFSKGAK